MSFFQGLTLMLTDMLGPLGPLYAMGGFGLLLVLGTVPFLMGGQKDPLEKLKKEAERSRVSGSTKVVLREKSTNEKLNKYAQFLEPQDGEQLTEMRQKLMQAGYKTRDAVRLYMLAQMGLALGGLILGLAYYFLMIDGPEATTQQMMMYILGPLVVGYMGPKYWINKRVAARKQEIQDGFPDALDMMLVCVEAGQSLDQSIVRVSKELRASYPALADEYEMVAHEMKAGKDKSQVLNDMGDRCGIQDISSFVTVLNQSQTFGTPVSDALRVYASEMRDKRVMRAEEKANKLPTKMTLVTMMFTVPPLLIILVGPSVVGISKMGSIGGGSGSDVELEKSNDEDDF